jgi:hypothetical protein
MILHRRRVRVGIAKDDPLRVDHGEPHRGTMGLREAPILVHLCRNLADEDGQRVPELILESQGELALEEKARGKTRRQEAEKGQHRLDRHEAGE